MDSNSEPISNSEIKEQTNLEITSKNENNNNTNNPQEEPKESISISDPENRVKKKITVQEENINGNYGRILIQESNKDSSSSQREEKKDKKIYKKIITTNPTTNANDNNNKRRNIASSVDNRNIENNKKNKKYNLRRKSIDRGGDYKNVQVTHIIYSIDDNLKFNIIDPLMIFTEEERKKYMKKIDKNNRNGRNGGVKVSYNSSCDKIKIAPFDKKKLKGKTSVVSHRQNNLKVINNKENKNKDKKEVKGNKEKDSIMRMNFRNKNNENKNISNIDKGNSASYKKRNEKK